jgi:hypothetical protein
MPSIRELSRITGIPKSTLHDRMQAAKASGFKVKGTSTLYDAEGEVRAEWIKLDEAKPSIEETAAQVRAALDGYAGPEILPPEPEHVDEDLVTVYIAADWHIGLLSWKKETGHNYDLKIATATIKQSIGRLVASAPAAKQAVVLGLGDLLHADGYDNQTARSKNALDVDGRYPRVLQTATELIIYTTDLALQRHEQVLVRILPGNHDDESALAVTLALVMFYKNNPRVTVDDDAGRYWWWSWGKVLLGATHGDQAKMKDLPLIMAARNPEAWGKSKFRSIYTGHIHRETAIENGGVTTESFRTPAAPDAWTVGMGYCPSRSMYSITHHKDHGEIMRQKVNIL